LEEKTKKNNLFLAYSRPRRYRFTRRVLWG